MALSAAELLQKSMTDHLNLGVSSQIDYRHVRMGTEEQGLFCFQAEEEYMDERKKIRTMRTTFAQVRLTQAEPVVGDLVTDADGVTYTVMRWEKQLGFYYLHCERKRHHTGARYDHRVDRGP